MGSITMHSVKVQYIGTFHGFYYHAWRESTIYWYISWVLLYCTMHSVKVQYFGTFHGFFYHAYCESTIYWFLLPAIRLGQYRADILGVLTGVSELLPALSADLVQLCRPSRDAPGGFPAKPGKR